METKSFETDVKKEASSDSNDFCWHLHGEHLRFCLPSFPDVLVNLVGAYTIPVMEWDRKENFWCGVNSG